MRNLNKWLMRSILLIVTVLCVALPAKSASAYSTGDTYPYGYKTRAKDSVVDQWGYYNRECTSFVAWCLNSRNGFHFYNYYGGVHFGNARTWLAAARRLGFTVDSNPKVGSVGVSTAGRSGHVVWIKAVHGNYVTTDEYNWNNDGRYHTRTTYKTAFYYIHFKDIITSYKLDVNVKLDGKVQEDGLSGVTYDISVGGSKTANNVTEYSAQIAKGKSYRVDDIKINGCYKLVSKKVRRGKLKSNVTITISLKTCHSYGKGEVTRSATCSEDGVKTYTCEACGAKKKKAISALGHDYTATIEQNETSEEDSECEETGTTAEDSPAAVVSGASGSSSSVDTVSVKQTGSKVFVCNRCGICFIPSASSGTASTSAKVVSAKNCSVKLSYKKTAYTGKACRPRVVVKNRKGKILTKNKDYTVTYSANRKLGKASVYVIFKGSYKGTLRTGFTIVPTAPKVKIKSGAGEIKVKMTQEDSGSGADFYQIRYRRSGSSEWSSKITTKEQTVIFTSLKSGKKYDFIVRACKTVDNVTYHSAWVRREKILVETA